MSEVKMQDVDLEDSPGACDSHDDRLRVDLPPFVATPRGWRIGAVAFA